MSQHSQKAHLHGELPELAVDVLHHERVAASLAEVHLGKVLHQMVPRDRLGALVDGVGQLLRRRPAVLAVVPAESGLEASAFSPLTIWSLHPRGWHWRASLVVTAVSQLHLHQYRGNATALHFCLPKASRCMHIHIPQLHFKSAEQWPGTHSTAGAYTPPQHKVCIRIVQTGRTEQGLRRAWYALDAKVLIRAAGVVAGGQDEASVGTPVRPVADHRRHRRRRHDAVYAHLLPFDKGLAG